MVVGCIYCTGIGLEDRSRTRCATPFAGPPCVDEHEEQFDLRSAVVVTIALIEIADCNSEARLIGHDEPSIRETPSNAS